MSLKRINFLILGLTPLMIAPIATVSCAPKTDSLNSRWVKKDLGRIKELSRSNIINQFMKVNPDLEIIDRENELDIEGIYYNRAHIRIHNAFWNKSKYGRSSTTLWFDSYIWPLYDYDEVVSLDSDHPTFEWKFAITKDFIPLKEQFEMWSTNRYLTLSKAINKEENVLTIVGEINKEKSPKNVNGSLFFKIEQAEMTWANFVIN